MNHQLTNNRTSIGFYATWVIWAILLTILLTGILKKNWQVVKRAIKYIINSIVFIIAWMFYLELALIVKPQILSTKQSSILALENWIRENQIEDIYTSIAVILILLSINLLFYYKIEHKKNKKDLLILALFAIAVLSFGIWLTGQDAYFGMLEEINRHFG
jgi:RsiW-degrading membrane proteinase PrsW (M82 family)